MAKTVDVPTELREFNKVFNELGAYRWDCAEVFDDLLDFMLACFSPTGDKELAERLKKRYGEDYGAFSRMMSAMLEAYKTGTYRSDWYDGLGLYYECIASNSKTSRLGQFFTPPSVCEILAQMNRPAPTEKFESGKTVSDPCSGSGRLLLAFNAVTPGCYYYACDIDRICAKMTAFNMCIHGMTGEVVCGNSLWLESEFYFGFQTNRLLKFGIPSIEKKDKEQCYQVGVFRKTLEEVKMGNQTINEKITKEKLQRKIAEKMAKNMAKTGQMNLF